MANDEGPDRGRAWVIAFAACIINMILSGTSRMIGILYVAIIDEYGVTRREATTPFSVRNSVRCLAGPLVGLVGQMIGIRTITFGGGIVASLGACLCSIAPNVLWLTILWGGVHGIGFAFANTLFQVIVNQYFEKYRTTASGIALSGACVGSMAFPFLFEFLIDKYGVSGAFLIIGGVVMHVLPPSLLLCSPPWLEKRRKEAARQMEQQAAVECPPTPSEGKPEASEVAEDEGDFQKHTVLRSTSFSDYPEDGIQVLSAEKRKTPERSSTRSKHSLHGHDNPLFHGTGKCPVTCVAYTIKEQDEISSAEKNGRNDLAIPVTDGCQPQNGHPTTPALNGNRQEIQPQAVSAPSEDEEHKKSLLDGLLSIVLLYKNPVYVLISVSMTTYVLIFIPILTVTVDYGKDKGMTESQGKYLINALAVGDLAGRLCFGWVTDKKYISVYKFMALCQLFQGGVVALFPLARSLYTFLLLLTIYGMMAGMVLVQFPVLVLKYVSIDDQPVAMGCVGFLSGLVTFGIPPIIGFFRDNLGSYDGMFYFIGGVSLVSGAVWLLEPVMARKLMKTRAKACARNS